MLPEACPYALTHARRDGRTGRNPKAAAAHPVGRRRLGTHSKSAGSVCDDVEKG